MTKLPKQSLLIIMFMSLIVGLFAIRVTEATHSWVNYHWSRSINPVTLIVGDNVSSVWDGHLSVAISDWNASSSAVELTKTPGLTNPKSCKPVLGRIEVCNAKYGRNGWLGLAQIWVNGDHITQAVSKMNDTYFNTAKYNTPAWRQLVMCQEVAHDFGLDHQDENFDNPNLGSCMDYTSDPDGPPSNEHPNAHDFEQLGVIYVHLDAALMPFANSIKGKGRETTETDFSDKKEWGKELRKDSRGRVSLYERDLGKEGKVITHVLWVE